MEARWTEFTICLFDRQEGCAVKHEILHFMEREFLRMFAMHDYIGFRPKGFKNSRIIGERVC